MEMARSRTLSRTLQELGHSSTMGSQIAKATGRCGASSKLSSGQNQLVARNRMTLCSLAAGLLIFAAGCAGSIPAASVYGAYRADYPFGHQTLTLRADGTYDQQVVIKQP